MIPRITQIIQWSWREISPRWRAGTNVCHITDSVELVKCRVLMPGWWFQPYPSEKWWSSSVGMIFHSQLFLESHNPFHGSSQHQPGMLSDVHLPFANRSTINLGQWEISQKTAIQMVNFGQSSIGFWMILGYCTPSSDRPHMARQPTNWSHAHSGEIHLLQQVESCFEDWTSC